MFGLFVKVFYVSFPTHFIEARIIFSEKEKNDRNVKQASLNLNSDSGPQALVNITEALSHDLASVSDSVVSNRLQMLSENGNQTTGNHSTLRQIPLSLDQSSTFHSQAVKTNADWKPPATFSGNFGQETGDPPDSLSIINTKTTRNGNHDPVIQDSNNYPNLANGIYNSNTIYPADFLTELTKTNQIDNEGETLLDTESAEKFHRLLSKTKNRILVNYIETLKEIRDTSKETQPKPPNLPPQKVKNKNKK